MSGSSEEPTERGTTSYAFLSFTHESRSELTRLQKQISSWWRWALSGLSHYLSTAVMDSQYSQQSLVERLIASGRVVLSVFSLLAIWFDPSEPGRYAPATYALLAGYVGYAFLLALLAWRSDAPRRRLSLVLHTFDLAVFSLFIHLTEGPASPFFVFFAFSIVCATLRWRLLGTLWTAVAALTIFIGTGVYASEVLHDPAFELNRFIIRSVYLAVLAMLLGYLGAYNQRLCSQMYRLAAWPHVVLPEAPALVHEALQHAAGILGAPRVLMTWEEPEEPWLYLASWSHSEFRSTREPPATFAPLVAEPLAGASFLCPDASAPVPTVLYTSSAGLRRWHGAPLHPDLQARFAVDAVLALNLCGETFEGHVFFLDMHHMTADDLVLGEVVARQLVADLDQFYLVQRLQQAAIMGERIRLARDLHDGLLQSLTGAALQLHTVHRLLAKDPRAAQQRLLDIQRQITDEQRDLRAFLQGLKSPLLLPLEADFNLAARLEKVSGWIEQQWGLHVEFSMQGLEVGISRALAHEIYRIIYEALVNAGRHAHASVVRVELGIEGAQVRITVADNGSGFPFQGRYDLAALTAMELGPKTLQERIASLGGSLTLDSNAAGARLEIMLPRQRHGGYNAYSSSAG